MPTLCDTHVLLFWAHEPERFSAAARQALGAGEPGVGLVKRRCLDPFPSRYAAGSVAGRTSCS